MWVMAGGSLMNFMLAFILFFVLRLLTGYEVLEIRGLQEGRPAHAAGLQVGDRITHVNGSRVSLYENFLLQLEFSGGEPMDVRVNRNGNIIHFSIAPAELSPGFFRLGFFPDFRYGLLQDPPEGYRRVGLWGTTTTAAEMMVFNIRLPFTILARFVTGQNIPAGAGVMGPIGMAGEVTVIYQQVIQHGVIDTVLTMLFFTALLNAALGLFNLLPIPAMDGARLVFLAIEGIRRKPVPPEKEGMVHLVGFVLIIALAIFIAYRDIVRLLPS
jgi:regulator of sigma E protease